MSDMEPGTPPSRPGPEGPGPPRIRHIANLRSLTQYPTADKEWSVERKLEAVKDAGFDGFATLLNPDHLRLAEQFGLIPVGYFSSGSPSEFKPLLEQNRAAGARHVTVQLGDHDTPTKVALKLVKRLMTLAERLGVDVAIEVQRDTCTETPEKTFALAEAYEKASGQSIPLSWDFSHFAVLKQLSPPYWDRLCPRPDLIQKAGQFHFRPFNGHHCQVPVTLRGGGLTPELLEFLPFVSKVIETWLRAAAPAREFFSIPEMGPVRGGYSLPGWPNSWEDAIILASEIDKLWEKAARSWVLPPADPGQLGRSTVIS